MKIIKQGQIPEKKVRQFRGTCSRCGCQIECTEDEANFSGERHPGGKQQWYINCPTKMCGSVITLNEVVLRQDGPLKKPTKDVHTEHCCILHGCKYGNMNKECTVVEKRAPQSYCCESCEMDGIHDMHDLERVRTGITQTCPYCGHTLP